MARLSVNVNKVATLRNSRTAQTPGPRGVPSVRRAAEVCIASGAPGITVHPRGDARHITLADVDDLAELLKAHPGVEFNIEGDPRPDLIESVLAVAPDQLTLVPVRPGEITSQAGWGPQTDPGPLRELVARVHARGTRVSIFVDPEPAPIEWAATLGADRVELFTEPFALAFREGRGATSFERYAAAARVAHEHGLGVNAGHDLDLDNLVLFRELPHLDEVSIGHALMAEALFDGLAPTVRRYLDVLAC